MRSQSPARRSPFVTVLLILALAPVAAIAGYAFHSGSANLAGAWRTSNAARADGSASGDAPRSTSNVTAGSSGYKPSPKGNGKIAFASSRDGITQIYTMNADGSNVTKLTSDGGDSPAWSPDGQKIAFRSGKLGDSTIFVMNADGSNQTQLSQDHNWDGSPAWSPDGKKVAFVRSPYLFVVNADGTGETNLMIGIGVYGTPSWSPDGTKIAFSGSEGNYDIYVANTDGTSRKRLTNNVGNDFSPNWSADGKRIAFQSNRDGNEEIYVMNSDGTNQTRLTTDGAEDSDPAFSPDATKITFTSARTGDKEIFVMNSDGSAQVNRTNDGAIDDNPDWQPTRANGKIVFSSTRNNNLDVYVMNADGSDQTRLTDSALQDTEPSFSPDGSKIIFVSARNNGQFEIYTMNADGSDQTRLTNNSDSEFTPKWSPDGKKIVFSKFDNNNNLDIYVMNANGTGETRLTSTAGADQSPAWSPDGKKIVFMSLRDGHSEIYAMNADGSGQTRLTNENSAKFDPVWSPDGAKIAYSSNATGTQGIYTINPDGTGAKQLTNNNDGSVAWSPDGSKIAFTSGRSGNNNIYLMNSDGSNQIQLTSNAGKDGDYGPNWGMVTVSSRIAFKTNRDGNEEIYVMYGDGSSPVNLTNNPETDEAPAWSRDGEKIAFHSTRDGQSEIYSMKADGTNQTRLTNDNATDNNPSWSHDGSRIAFNSDRDGNPEIYVMDADGKNQTRLTNNSSDDINPAWSPGGTKIAFQSTRDGHNEIYLINADGSGETRLTTGSADNYLPAWSPDGTKLAFVSLRDGNAEIYVIDADGKNQKNVSNNSSHDVSPGWSADGSQIVFRSSRDSNGEVYVMNSDGTEQKRLTYNSATDGEPEFRPETSYSISGKLTDGANPIANVTVMLTGTQFATTTTDGNGNYTFNNLFDGSYTVTPTDAGYSFNPQSASLLGLSSNQIINFTGTIITHTISGTIKEGQTPMSGVVITAEDKGFLVNTTTDGNGFYSFTLKAGGNYTITPSKQFYSFMPSSFSFGSLNMNLTVDFTGKQDTYSISGYVRDDNNQMLAGVTIDLGGTQQATATTDGNGFYSFNDLALDGNYTVTPSKTDYSFSPASKSFNKLQASESADFTAELKIYKIKGRIKDADGKALSNVLVTLEGVNVSPALTDQNGDYELYVRAKGNYTVTPSLTYYSFTPASLNFQNVSGDQTGADFTGSLVNYSISGKVVDQNQQALAGATVKLSGAKTAEAISDSNGKYAFTNLPATRDYKLTASKANRIFIPSERNVLNLTGDSPDNDFTGELVSYSISGTVTDSDGKPLSDVSVHVEGNGFSSDTATSSNGKYKINSLRAEGDYVVTVSVPDYDFTPQNRSYNSLSGDITTADFTGSLKRYTISGQIITSNSSPLSGVTVTLSGSQEGTTTTDASGNYFFSGLLAKGNYTVTPAKANYTFSPQSRTYASLGGSTLASFQAIQNLYSITVSLKNEAGSGLVGATVTLASNGSLIVVNQVKDSSGIITFENLSPEKNYTLTPAYQGWSFDPAEKTFNNLSGNQQIAFTGTQLLHSISGRVMDAGYNGIFGVTMTLSGAQTATITTDAQGNYNFGALAAGGTYTVTPSKTNFSFTPPSHTFDNLSGNVQLEFTGQGVTYSIGGQVLNENNIPIPGVVVSLSGSGNAQATTDLNGNYFFGNLTAGGNYTVTPALSGYAFTPQNKAFNNLSANEKFDFTAVPAQTIGITGRVTEGTQGIANVVVSLTGTQVKTVTTDGNGQYGFDGLPAGGNYTVTPSLTPYSFTPQSQTFNNMEATHTNVNFSAERPRYTIGGTVLDEAGKGIGGVSIALTGSSQASATTDGNGTYSFTGLLASENYTLTPAKSGYDFTPATQSINKLGGNESVNFTGKLIVVPATVGLDSSSYTINEGIINTEQGFTSLTVNVTRAGDSSGPVTVQYLTSDQAGGDECNQMTGKASQRCDYTTAAGTLRFAPGELTKTIYIPIIADGYVEGQESFNITLQNPLGASLGTKQAAITITDSGVATTGVNNPYLSSSFFVRQNYLDFLGREPDANGFTDWRNVLNNCGSQQGFLGAPKNCDRAHVSHGFFASPEFTDRGYLIYRLYEVAMNRLPRYSEFIPDMATLSGFGLPANVQEQNLHDYLQQFSQKAEFTNRFAGTLSTAQAAELILRLEQAAGITLPATATTQPGQPTQYGRAELINKRLSGDFTVGQTLKAFVEQKDVYDRYFERGFVTMQYFGYLRRDPDLGDPQLTGWNEWVYVFTNGGATRGRPDIGVRDYHHLIFGFIYSEEYRKRFGQP
ncbi:MAG TPA: carboxypeptidase regulatory-like domain-containing protein [Pyrinomonadaceae bacterium]|jgi:Tol biopolymer transport system component